MDFVFASSWPIAFDESRLQNEALGGSETALIELSAELVGRGAQVALFVPDPEEGERQGRRWYRLSRLEAMLEAGELKPRVLVICRDAALWPLHRFADQSWLWLQDMPMAGLRKVFTEASAAVQRILAISDFQQSRFRWMFALEDPALSSRFCRTRNGVRQGLFAPLHDTPKIPGRLCYASTPFRGLAHLLDAFPAVRARCPHATLEVLGGMRAYDQDEAPFAELYERAAAMPGVIVAGPRPQAEVAAALARAELLAYPCSFREAGCIVVQMAIAAGTPPVTSSIACLPEYVGDRGVLVPGDPREAGTNREAFMGRYVDALCELLETPERIEALRQRCYAHEVGWAPVAEQWLRWADAALGAGGR